MTNSNEKQKANLLLDLLKSKNRLTNYSLFSYKSESSSPKKLLLTSMKIKQVLNNHYSLHSKALGSYTGSGIFLKSNSTFYNINNLFSSSFKTSWIFDRFYVEYLLNLLEYKKQNSNYFFTLSDYYKIGRKGTPVKGLKSPRDKKERSMKTTYFINRFLHKTYLNRQHSFGNYYNRTYRLYLYLSNKDFDFQRSLYKKVNNHDDFLESISKNRIYSGIKSIIFLLHSIYIYKKIIYHLIDNKVFLVKLNEKNLLDFFKKKIKISKNIPQKIFPRDYRLYKPFLYRAYKYGKKADLNFFKNFTYSGLQGHRLKKGLNGKYFGWKVENASSNFTNNKKPTHVLGTFSSMSLFEDWYISITDKYNYNGYNRNIKLFPKNTHYSFFTSSKSTFMRYLMKKIWNQEAYSYLHMLVNLKKFRNFAKSFF